MRQRLLTAFLLAATTFAAGPGIDSDHLKLIPARMQEFVDRGDISGVVTLVAYHGEIVELDAVGFADIEHKKPMRTDSILQLMSQTKSFTSTAAMMLVEQGKLDLARPVEYYLPEYRGQMVEEKRADGTVSIHPPKHPPTVGQMLSHTSGLAFLPSAGPYQRINFTLDATLADAVKGYAQTHLTTEPGTHYFYSNMGIATVGRIVEVLSGQDYAHFVTTRILDPLGMKDTFFFPPDAKKGRIAMIYLHRDGKLALAGDLAQAGDPARYRAGAKYPGPELGLYSTATDLQRFYQMLGNGGVFGGRRYLSKQSLEAMTQDDSPDHNGYGLGLQTVHEPGMFHLLSPGTFGLGGAFGTGGWFDPKNELVLIFLPQMEDGSAAWARNAFWQIAESAVR